MRASRLLSVLLLLQTRGRMTAPQLADELEVSVRTIYRDLEALGMAGVPVYAERGPAGGYALVDGYRTRLTGLTDDEAGSLALVGVPGAAAELGLGTVLAAAELKLDAALPPELRSRAARVRQRFHLDAPGWYKDPDGEPTPHLEAVAAAAWDQRRLRVRYRSWRDEVERTLEPLGLVLKAGTWYAVARADGRDEPRTYRVGRLLGVTELDERFAWPDEFDLSAYWAEQNRRFRDEMYRDQAVVRAAPDALAHLARWSGRAVAEAIEATRSEPDAHGWRTVTIPIEGVWPARNDLLRLGGQAEVLAPTELREAMTEVARGLAEVYGAADDGPPVPSAATSTPTRARSANT